MKVLVTGASGFIGSTLIQQLNARGDEVFALMRKTSKPSNLEGLQFHRVEGDLSQEESLHRAVQGMDVIFHLAGATAARNREEYFENNAAGTARLARAVSLYGQGLKRFIYVSSLAAGGPAISSTPKIESDVSQPVSYYGQSKLQGEVEVLKFASFFPISIVRPPIVYGPKDKGVFLMVQSVARHLMPLVRGATADGNKYYSVIHAEDLCRGLILAAQVQSPAPEVFYLCEEQIYSYQEIMMTIAKKLNRKTFRFFVPRSVTRAAAFGMSALGALTGRSFPLNRDKLNEILPDYWICSNQKAKKILGFQSEFDLVRGMDQTIDWYRKHNWI